MSILVKEFQFHIWKLINFDICVSTLNSSCFWIKIQKVSLSVAEMFFYPWLWHWKNPLCHVVDRKENLLHLNFKLSVRRVFQVSACQRFCGTWTVSGPQTRSPAFNFERTLMRRYLLKVFSWWSCLSKWGVGPFERGNHLSAQGQQCWSGQSHCVSVIIKNWEDSKRNGTHLGCVLQ